MKKLRILTVCILAMTCQTFAQQRIDVSLTLAHNIFITGEPVVIQAKVTNQTRDPLEFGEGAKDAFFIEVSKDSRYNELSPESDKPFIKSFTLMPGNAFERHLEADKWFSLYENGKYLIRAVVVHGSMRYESPVKTFDVLPGIPLKQGLQMFSFRKHLQRNFTLVQWTRAQSKHLFLRIEDEPDGLVWDTIDLGEIYQDEEPKLDIAPNGEVAVFHRINADYYLRTVIWSLPDSVEIAERNSLLSAEASAAKRVRSTYGDTQKTAEEKQSSWWKFWK